MSNQPFSEQYRIAAKELVKLRAAANLLEESKSAVLARLMADRGDVPVSHAERDVKASEEWQEYITKMVNARADAELKQVEVNWINMRYWEHQGHDANKRAEMRL